MSRVRHGLAAVVVWGVAAAAWAQEAQGVPAPDAPPSPKLPRYQDPPGCTRLSPKFNVWLDKPNKRLVMVGEVCQTAGPMEMFACLQRTKEHESIVAVPTEAFIVHAGLVALGAEPGGPVQFRPEYKPPRGTEIGVSVYWSDAQGGRRQARAQDWLMHVQTGQPLEHPWVFAGSGFWTDPLTKERHYQAEEGDFICISNFPSAMLDLPVESSASNAALLFEANPDKIPPKGTPVTLVLTPRLKDLPPDRGGDPKADTALAK